MKWYVPDALSPVTVHVGLGVGVKQVPEPEEPVFVIIQVVPAGLEGGVQVNVTLVEVWLFTERVGTLSAPAAASPYVPVLVAEK